MAKKQPKRKRKAEPMPVSAGKLTLALPVSKRKRVILQHPLKELPTRLQEIANGIAQIEDKDEIEQLCSGAISALFDFEQTRKDCGERTGELLMGAALFLLLVRTDQQERSEMTRTIASAERALLVPEFLPGGVSLRLELGNSRGFGDPAVVHL